MGLLRQQVINLQTGELKEVELPYTQEQKEVAIKQHKFIRNGIKYGGWCKRCNRLVIEEDATYLVNKWAGIVVAEPFHKKCL